MSGAIAALFTPFKPVQAALVQFNSQSAWLSAVEDIPSVETFTGATGSFNNGQTVDLGTFEITGFGDYNNSGYGPGNFFTNNFLSGGVDASPSTGFTISYDNRLSAFGFNFSGACTGGCAQLEILGNQFTVATNGCFGAPNAFIGIVATEGETFTDIIVQSAGFSAFGQAESFVADNFASVEAVPEPLTILGAGTAIAFGTAFKRKFSKNKKKK